MKGVQAIGKKIEMATTQWQHASLKYSEKFIESRAHELENISFEKHMLISKHLIAFSTSM